MGLVLGALAALTLANAGWMLVAPAHWYANIPAAVPDFGPLNVHFVRDVGCAYFTQGVALGWAALWPGVRVPCLSLAAVFGLAHAALHVFDIATGAVGHVHTWIDLPWVFAPGLLYGGLALHAARSPRAASR